VPFILIIETRTPTRALHGSYKHNDFICQHNITYNTKIFLSFLKQHIVEQFISNISKYFIVDYVRCLIRIFTIFISYQYLRSSSIF